MNQYGAKPYKGEKNSLLGKGDTGRMINNSQYFKKKMYEGTNWVYG